MEKKARNFHDTDKANEILATSDPAEAKRLGKEIKNFNQEEWLKVAPDIMKQGLLAKFGQNEHLKQFLIETGNTTLVECNPTDRIWSCGFSMTNPRRKDPRNWLGTNLLGKILEEVRSILKTQ